VSEKSIARVARVDTDGGRHARQISCNEEDNSLDHSYQFIQRPPGCGKTFTAGHVIMELMRHGEKVGVAANSHRAI
jgi:hypothetical protein